MSRISGHPPRLNHLTPGVVLLSFVELRLRRRGRTGHPSSVGGQVVAQLAATTRPSCKTMKKGQSSLCPHAKNKTTSYGKMPRRAEGKRIHSAWPVQTVAMMVAMMENVSCCFEWNPHDIANVHWELGFFGCLPHRKTHTPRSWESALGDLPRRSWSLIAYNTPVCSVQSPGNRVKKGP